MRIPHTQLSQAALQEVVQEFVTRDGTDHSTMEKRVTDIMVQLKCGTVELHFDMTTRTCNIVQVEN